MTPELRLQMDRQRELTKTLNEIASRGVSDIRDRIIAEQRVQIKDLQDFLYCRAPINLGHTWLNDEPEDDNGDYAKGLRS